MFEYITLLANISAIITTPLSIYFFLKNKENKKKKKKDSIDDYNESKVLYTIQFRKYLLNISIIIVCIAIVFVEIVPLFHENITNDFKSYKYIVTFFTILSIVSSLASLLYIKIKNK